MLWLLIRKWRGHSINSLNTQLLRFVLSRTSIFYASILSFVFDSSKSNNLACIWSFNWENWSIDINLIPLSMLSLSMWPLIDLINVQVDKDIRLITRLSRCKILLFLLLLYPLQVLILISLKLPFGSYKRINCIWFLVSLGQNVDGVVNWTSALFGDIMILELLTIGQLSLFQ